MAKTRSDTLDIWSVCDNNGINADSSQDINYGFVSDVFLILYDSGNGAVAPNARCLLIDPALVPNTPSGWLTKVMRYASEHKIAITFRVLDAAYYQHVFVFGALNTSSLSQASDLRLTFFPQIPLSRWKKHLDSWI